MARRTLRRRNRSRARSSTAAYRDSQPKVSRQNSSPSRTNAVIGGAPGGTNCGSRLRKNATIFGLARLLPTP